jgi:hypothetical protein
MDSNPSGKPGAICASIPYVLGCSIIGIVDEDNPFTVWANLLSKAGTARQVRFVSYIAKTRQRLAWWINWWTHRHDEKWL